MPGHHPAGVKHKEPKPGRGAAPRPGRRPWCASASQTSASGSFERASVVGVSPAYDHAELTSVAAAHVCFGLLALMLLAAQ